MTVFFRRTVPILRIFDITKALEFYVDYLGFKVDWEHRYAAGLPVYLQVSRDGLTLHLSEHHGDATPGSAVYVEADGVGELHAELSARNYPYLKPGLEEDSQVGTVLELTDPFGNRLRLVQPDSVHSGDA
ncbi:glyoxalase superfamily protein [Streptomyces sp. NPDC051940]|uniref:glyoxalase superfamily protein n=1 Tax=Streptomyces sp. NPDC051940 TaxID=3155675 RepID=UPI00341FEA57